MSEDRRLDLVLAAIFLILGGYIVLAARGLQSLPGLPVGPGVFPTLTGLGMVLFALILGVQTLTGRSTAAEAADPDPDFPENDLPEAVEPGFWGRRFGLMPAYGVVVSVAILITVWLMPVLGFRITGFLLSLVVVLAGGGGWKGAVIFSALLTLAIHAMFTWGFRVQLPIGIW